MATKKPKLKTQQKNYSKIFSLRFSRVGLAVAGLFYAFSLFPSMLPRSYILQAVISAISFSIGYGLGVFAEWLWHYLQIPGLKGTARKIAVWGGVGFVVFAICSSTIQSIKWQNQLRDVFVMDHIGITFIVFALLLTVVIAAVLIIIGRSIRKLYQITTAAIQRLLPRRVSIALGVLVIFTLLNFLYTGVLAKLFFGISNQMFSKADVKISAEYKQPSSSYISGSKDSLASWESLGKQGRKFVATTPSGSEITAITNEPAKSPIRAYVGLQSAPTIDKRADLLLQELIRTKAFERKNLMLAISTGSGWIDTKSIEPFEYMHNGDTAVAGIQYSYLPSWISLLADQSKVIDTSNKSFRKILDYWSQLPEDSRPHIYLYGLSLGSFGAGSVLNSIELVNEPISGGLLAGPPFVNILHKSIVENRDAGSPAWQPIYNDGKTVRFYASKDALSVPKGQWGNTKIVYLQHATDPVVWFSKDLMFKYPDWLKEGQRGPGIIKDFVWVPIVTFWQMAGDLPAAGSVKDGFGHNYSTSENVDTWSAISSPEGWTAAKDARLKAYFASKKYAGA